MVKNLLKKGCLVVSVLLGWGGQRNGTGDHSCNILCFR